MQGKVTMNVVVCRNCGRPRQTVARAPWGELVIICRSCKQMTPTADAELAVDTVAGAAERGLPRAPRQRAHDVSMQPGKDGAVQGGEAPIPAPDAQPDAQPQGRRRRGA